MDRHSFTTAIVSLGFEADSDSEFWLGRDVGLRLDADGSVALLDANGRPANGRHGYDDALDHLRRNLGAGYGSLKGAWEVRESSTAKPVADDLEQAARTKEIRDAIRKAPNAARVNAILVEIGVNLGIHGQNGHWYLGDREPGGVYEYGTFNEMRDLAASYVEAN